ncbi:MAG: cation diffusion facilitator family transporter [Actinomycetia bacterium]|nr:cation diffusion facilitator family transporter [Actinomycetes bacterium]
MSGDHNHGVSIRAGSRYRGRLTIVFGLVVGFMVIEAIAAVISGSLALLSDAGHMATDAIGIGMALAAIVAADNVRERPQHTYGVYRLEVLAALANAVLLFAVAGYVFFEAIRRLTGETPEVLSGPMLVVAVAGLAVNVVSWWLLREGAEESINVEGAFVEVLADMIGSVAVIVAAIIIWLTGWAYVDAIFGIGIGLFILPRAWRLGSKALRILIEAAPPSVDVGELTDRLGAIPGVVDVHDLHVWTLTSDMEIASVHLMTVEDADPHPVLDAARMVIRDEFGVGHATLQVEPESHSGCAEVDW